MNKLIKYCTALFLVLLVLLSACDKSANKDIKENDSDDVLDDEISTQIDEAMESPDESDDTVQMMISDDFDIQGGNEWITSTCVPNLSISLEEAHKLYADFIMDTLENNPDKNYDMSSTAFLYICDDEIPVLLIGAVNEYPRRYSLSIASSAGLHTIEAAYIRYVENGNLIYDTGRWDSRNNDIVYSVENGEFVVLHSGKYVENDEGDWPNNYTWYWNDHEVPYAEYSKRRDDLDAVINSYVPYYEHSATSALRFLFGEPALTVAEERAMKLAKQWLEDNGIYYYVECINMLVGIKTINNEEYYHFGCNDIGHYYIGVLVHTKTDELLYRHQGDGPASALLVQPIYDYFFDDGSKAKETAFDYAVLNTPDYISFYIEWDDGSYLHFSRGYYESSWIIIDDEYRGYIEELEFSYVNEALTFTFNSDPELYYLHNGGHGTKGETDFTWYYYIFNKRGMW
ncbi:MAG: hypothetical protein FWG88_08250 [Oscillospiraceae bacterium]|nr:hypothetical protein [Oscillospiraceae bacterium]